MVNPRALQALRLLSSGRFGGAGGLASWVSGTAATSVLILLFNLGGSVVVARGLGPEGRGSLAVAMLWPILIAGFGGLGVQEAVSYFSVVEPEKKSPTLATALWIGAAQSALLIVIGYSVLPFILQGKPGAVLAETDFYLWILPLYPLTLYPIALFQGRLALRAFNLTRLSVHALYTGLLIVLWIGHHLTVHTALAASMLATAGTFLLCIVILAARGYWTWRPSWRLVQPILWFGARLHIGDVAGLVTLRADLLALSLLVSASVLGNYVIATATGLIAGILPTAASMVLYPVFSRQDPARLPLSLSRFLLAGGIVSILLSPLLLLLPLCVTYVYGSGFREAQALAWVLVPAYAIRGWTLMLTSILRGLGRPLQASLCQGAELASLVALLFVLIPGLGAMGAALAVLGGAAMALAVTIAAASRTARLTPANAVRLWSSDLRHLRLALADGAVYSSHAP